MAPVDREKLRSQIDFVRRTLRRLEELRDEGHELFMAEDVRQAAAVRWLQTAIEALIDMANHVIAREGLGVPRAYADTMEILVGEGVLPAEKREVYLRMVRFRNRVVHMYDEVDADQVWEIIDARLSDFETFIAAIVSRYMA